MSEHFNELFDHWSANYDDTVSGRDVEYKEVFKYYDDILQNIADRAFGSVLEFGVGTGNLTKDRKSTRLNSSHVSISYAVFCLKKKKDTRSTNMNNYVN